MAAAYDQHNTSAASALSHGSASSTPCQESIPMVRQSSAAHDYTSLVMNAALMEQGYSGYDASQMSSPAFHSTPHTPASFPAGGNGSFAAQSQGHPKRYTHNPYAASEPTSPAVEPTTPTGSFTSADSTPFFSAAYSSDAVANGSGVFSHDMPPAMLPPAHGTSAPFSPAEQFAQMRGSMLAAAATPRGRHVILAALRQQSPERLQAVFDELVPNITAAVADQNGCHIVRTMLEYLNDAQASAFVDAIPEELCLTLATASQHTRRVLQTLFERFRVPALQRLVDIISTHATALATTQQGCIAVMRIVENASDPQKVQLLDALRPQLAALTMDPYGNYVVQSVIQHFPVGKASEVLRDALATHWVELSCNKFASNVLEKIIRSTDTDCRRVILEEVVFTCTELHTVMADGFGNFVLQSIVDTCADMQEYRRLADRIRPLLPQSPFGHKIEAKLKAKRFDRSMHHDAPASPASMAQGRGHPGKGRNNRRGGRGGQGSHISSADVSGVLNSSGSSAGHP